MHDEVERFVNRRRALAGDNCGAEADSPGPEIKGFGGEAEAGPV